MDIYEKHELNESVMYVRGKVKHDILVQKHTCKLCRQHKSLYCYYDKDGSILYNNCKVCIEKISQIILIKEALKDVDLDKFD